MLKIVILLLLLVTPILAQNYLWPTEASKLITSSFCEFRPRHFHAALDIKTWNRVGYKIFAIEDGYLYRIRVSSSGYGKAIYLKLNDGNIVVYAHLNGFIPQLEDYTDSLRLAARRNDLDNFLKPSQFVFKKGDLLGYTGETGIGVPHLHFELRDAKNRPINPMQFYYKQIKDDLPSQPQALAIIPLSASTLINFKPDTLILNLTSKQMVNISEPIYLSGKALLALKSFDQADGANNRFSFYKAQLYVNDSLIYQVKYDRFSYADTRLVELDKNYSLWRRGLGIFHNFYRHPFNHLSFYETFNSSNGILSGNCLNEGFNKVVLELYDFAGNHTEIYLNVVYHKRQQLKLFDLSTLSEVILVGLKSSIPLQKLEVKYLTPENKKNMIINNFELKLLNEFMDQYYYSLSLPRYQNIEFSSIQINAFDTNDNPLLPFYFNLNDPSINKTHSDFQIEKVRFCGDQVLIKSRNSISVSNDKKSEKYFSYQTDPNTYYTVVNADTLKNSTDKNYQQKMSDIFNWTQILPGKSSSVFSSDKNFRLDFPTDAVYDTFFCSIFTESLQNSSVTNYPQITSIYSAKPFDQVLNWGAMLSFRVADSVMKQKGLGVYYWDNKKGWLFLPSDYNYEKNVFRGRITSLEKFVVIKDTIPPEILPINLSQSGVFYINKIPIRLSVRDMMSGIYDQDQISVYLDDQWSLFRFDPEEDLVIISPKYINSGKHILKITANDNVGNQSTKEFTVHKQ